MPRVTREKRGARTWERRMHALHNLGRGAAWIVKKGREAPHGPVWSSEGARLLPLWSRAAVVIGLGLRGFGVLDLHILVRRGR